MLKRPLRILQVNAADIGGGAERIAWNLLRQYRARGHSSWLVVGNKHRDDPDVMAIPRLHHSCWRRLWLNLEERLKSHEGNGRAVSRARTLLRILASPRRALYSRFGVEDFDYPGTHRLVDLPPDKPDIIHCHNLHGGYFDPRVIPWLSQRAPLMLTLHDAWLLSGHCAHSFDCERWKTGCGQCPDLTIYPAINRDATAYNWRRKRGIFSRSRFFVATPSKWLMQKVEQSILWNSVAEARIIHNGVDLTVFHPAKRRSLRAALNLPQDAIILIFTAHEAQTNIFKDYITLQRAMIRLGRSGDRGLLFLCLGGEASTERIGNLELRVIPYQTDTKTVAHYYQAADLYVHASRADTFPCSVLEALACGTPVIANAVGGIPEQIKGLRDLSVLSLESNDYGPNHATGILVPAADSEAMAEGIHRLAYDVPLRLQMSRNASKDARERFDLNQQAERYINWYKELIDAGLYMLAYISLA
jgi:glycosyltransferase involved in cell wall biosynthesis